MRILIIDDRAHPGRHPDLVIGKRRRLARLRLGANSYLVKPVEFEGLLEMLRNLGIYWLVHNVCP